MFQTGVPFKSSSVSSKLHKKIETEKDAIYFKTQSPAYRTILEYVKLLCERIHGTGNKVYNNKYRLKDEVFIKCSDFLAKLEKLSNETDLKLAQSANTLRFGHTAYREWFDNMKNESRSFIDELAPHSDEQYREELYVYLSESFGNRMRIDYGTGHELNFILFTIGLSGVVNRQEGDQSVPTIDTETLKSFVESYGFDVHALFARHYLKLCRDVQTKFRLEPAGSRGVYNIDDFQFLPFLFGAAQLCSLKYIPTRNFYEPDQVDMFKSDFIFFEALDIILNNKKGPFNEHSYTLWNFTSLGSWDNIYRRIRTKFNDEILNPFPIIQHLLFGKYILKWNNEQ